MSPAPLGVRDGLGPARVRVHGGLVIEEFERRFGAGAKVAEGGVFTADGTALDATTVLPPGTPVYLYRDLPDEVEVPFAMPVLHRDDDVVVVDKPHFLATMPRGSHVAQTALVRLRRELDLPELAPAHRLDRLTAGVLLFTARREVRGAYQQLFARGLVAKTYLARAGAPGVESMPFPRVLRSRIVKERGRLQAREVPGPVNAETLVERLGGSRGGSEFRLSPRTGRTHQLRVHMAALGLPIDGDPLYPQVRDVDPGDFTRPLALVARTLEFTDPLSGRSRRFVSERELPGSDWALPGSDRALPGD